MRFILTILLFITLNAQATHYYVSNAGSNAAAGTSQGASWQTVAKVNGSTFSPGDTISFKRGDVFREQCNPPSSGNSSNPIVFDDYGTGAKPLFLGSNLMTGWTNAGSNQWYINNPNVTTTWAMVSIGGTLFSLVNSQAAVNSAGKYFIDVAASPDRLYVYSTVDPATLGAEISNRDFGFYVAPGAFRSWLVIRNLEFRLQGSGGVTFDGNGSQVAGHCRVEDCTFYGQRHWSVMSRDGHGTNTYLRDTATYSGNAFYTWLSNNQTMQRCYSAHSIVYPDTDGGAFQSYASDNFLVEFCESHDDNDALHCDNGGNPDNGIMRYNKIYDSKFGSGGSPNTPTAGEGSVTAGGLIQFYYNLWVNGASSNIESYSTNGGTVQVFNNTMYCDAAHATDANIYLVNGANFVFKNNLIIRDYVFGKRTLVVGGTMAVMDYNLYWITNAGINPKMKNLFGTDYTTMTTWRTASSQDAHSLNVDPLFTNIGTSDFTLQPSSPAINAGVNVGLTTDLAGNAITGAPDMGAYEYTASGQGAIKVKGHKAVVR